MGDRTIVTLTVLREHADEAITYFTTKFYTREDNITHSMFKFEEINYGELDFLPDLLNAGIAYDSHWDDGCDYKSGKKSLRFTSEGYDEIKESYFEDSSIIVDALLSRINDYKNLKAYILRYAEERAVLPWSAQATYGKKYVTLKLISP